MKAKSILIGVFTFITFISYAQTEITELPETKNTFTELSVETSNFDWTMLKEMFQDNKDQVITLVFTFLNKAAIDKTKIRVDNFKFKASGKTSDLDKLTAGLKTLLRDYRELTGK